MADFKWVSSDGSEVVEGKGAECVIIVATEDGVSVHGDAHTESHIRMAQSFCKMLHKMNLLDMCVEYARTSTHETDLEERWVEEPRSEP